MARIEIPAGDGPETTRALALRPQLQAAIDQLERAVWKSTLDRRLHELVRMRVARSNRCAVCMNWRNPTWCDDEALLDAVERWRDAPGFTAGERLALEYAERFCENSTSIDDDLVRRLEAELGPASVVELTLVTGKYLALGRFMQVLGLDQACALHFDESGTLTQTV